MEVCEFLWVFQKVLWRPLHSTVGVCGFELVGALDVSCQTHACLDLEHL